MTESIDRVFVVHWEGPFAWGDRDRHIRDGHVLYALFGLHPLYGRDVVLYIGKAGNGMKSRLDDHDKEWVQHEYDPMTVRLASMGLFKGWDNWTKKTRYPKPDIADLRAVESLLILANQPAYNSAAKQGSSQQPAPPGPASDEHWTHRTDLARSELPVSPGCVVRAKSLNRWSHNDGACRNSRQSARLVNGVSDLLARS